MPRPPSTTTAPASNAAPGAAAAALASAGPAPGWAADMAWRMRRHLLLKTLGITAFMWVFFVAYFYLLRHPAREVLVMPLTALDRAIPFQPMAFVAYVSLWVYVGIAPGLMLTLREVLVYGLWMGGLCLAGLACFWLVPTAVPPFDFAGGGIVLLQGIDAAGNACPSLHVATAVFSAVWVHRLLRLTGARAPWMWLNAAWAAAIVYSTLAIKQHVVWDAVGGTLLALAFAGPALRWSTPRLRLPAEVAVP